MSTLDNPSNETWAASHLEPEFCGDTRHGSSTGSFCCSSPALTLAPIRADSTRSGCREHNARFMHCPTKECRYVDMYLENISRYLFLGRTDRCMTAWALCPGYQCYLVLSSYPGEVCPLILAARCRCQVVMTSDNWRVQQLSTWPGVTPAWPGHSTGVHTLPGHGRLCSDGQYRLQGEFFSTMQRPHFVLSDLLWTAVVHLPHKTKSEMLVK